jgi:Ca2+-binding RTX toxin-like protein
MKRLTLISLAILMLQAPALGRADHAMKVPVLAGGPEANVIDIWLSSDGRSYVIDSASPLGVGGGVCVNPEGNPNELLCRAPKIAGFIVNADNGDDQISVAKNVPIPVTISGGAGNDLAVGGAGNDLLEGGAGNDTLIGREGADVLRGWEGKDVLIGGAGDDVLRGGYGEDRLRDGPGKDAVRQS